MAFEPISASIMGALSIGQSLFGASQESRQRQQQYQQEKDRVLRENQLNAKLIAASNKRTADIYGYQTGRFAQNLGFIQEDFARAGEDLQRELGQAFAQSAYSRQGQLAALSQAVGFNRAAFEGSSRSRQRADVLGTLGTFGRNAAMEAERLAGVVGQTGRSRQALGRQATQSVFNAYGDLGILPELQQFTAAAMPNQPFKPNMGLTIMNALASGASSAISAGTAFG
ncbi:MAG: hypothetical protein ACO3YZ_04550 [Candidatus Nanopelagicaceae bacterium]